MKHTIRRWAIALGVAGLLVTGMQAPGQGARAAGPGDLLSTIGERGVDDLRACLASSDSLQAYYLVDSSGSMKDTDRGMVRAELLANSLRELASLREDLTVSYAVGFFSDRFTAAIPWTVVDAGSIDPEADRLAERVRAQPASGGTDWRAAVAGALGELRAVERAGCQTVIWLTDGGISVGNNSPRTNATALNDLCGAPVHPDGASPAGGSHGVFSELRQNGIVVFGVMLRDESHPDEQRQYVPYMRPLVEGEGDVNGVTVVCGEHPVPERFANGVYLEATSDGDLAVVFLRLGVLVSGGTNSAFGPDGTFPVDRGVATFSIVATASDWSLRSPDGTVVAAGDAASRGFTVTTSGGATRLTSPPLGADDVGTWTWRSSSSARDALYYSSGLRLQLDQPSVFLAGADNELSGRVLRDGADWVGLDAYDYRLELAVVTPSGEIAVDADRLDLDEETGEFTFHYEAADASGLVTLQASLQEVRSRPSGIPLASISARQDVTVTLSDNYPTISPLPVVLSDLEGAEGVAEGTFTLNSPKDGTAGAVCFPGGLAPRVDSDAGDRGATWKWSFDPELGQQGDCVELAPGTETVVSVAVSNPVAANGDVTAHLDVEYRTANGETISGTLPITFTTTRPVNAAAFGIVAVLLLALGLLLPLILLWAFGWWFTRMSRGRELLRASLPVLVGPDGRITTSDGTPLQSVRWGLDQFKFESPRDDSRRFEDPELGTFRARVGLNPFGRPWYQLEPREGHLVIGPSDFLPPSLRARGTEGRLLGVKGDLGHVWALAIRESALAGPRDEAIPAQLVVFVRNPTGESAAYQDRMRAVASYGGLTKQLAAARDARAASDERDVAKVRARSQPPEREPVRSSRASDEPPRRTGAAGPSPEPPRRSVAPRADDPPHRRGGAGGGPPSRGGEPPRRASGGPDEPPRRPSRPGGGDEPPRRSR